MLTVKNMLKNIYLKIYILKNIYILNPKNFKTPNFLRMSPKHNSKIKNKKIVCALLKIILKPLLSL